MCLEIFITLSCNSLCHFDNHCVVMIFVSCRSIFFILNLFSIGSKAKLISLTENDGIDGDRHFRVVNNQHISRLFLKIYSRFHDPNLINIFCKLNIHSPCMSFVCRFTTHRVTANCFTLNFFISLVGRHK